MDEQKPLRLAVVGTATSVRQLARRSGEFASFRVTAEFADDGNSSEIGDWLDGEPTAQADAVCFLDEHVSSVALAEQSIARGLHVWCAGPLTAEADVLDSVAAQAAAADVTLVSGGAAGYTGGAQLAADALASGALGRLVCLRTLQLGGDPQARWPLAEQLALANSLADDMVATVYGQSAGKRHLSVSVSYVGGATALLALGAAPGTPPVHELMVLGNRGAFYDTMAATALLMLPAGEGDGGAYREEDAGPALARWADQCAQAAAGGAAPPVTVEQAREVVELMNYIEQAVESGEPMIVRDVEEDEDDG
jgi:predicted dehydrogenase